MGTIGNTHGVKSESAPTVIASQIKDQSHPDGAPVALSWATGPAVVAVEFTAFGSVMPPPLFEFLSVVAIVVAGAVGDGCDLPANARGECFAFCGTLAVDSDSASAELRVITVMIVVSFTVRGGKQFLSLQV